MKDNYKIFYKILIVLLIYKEFHNFNSIFSLIHQYLIKFLYHENLLQLKYGYAAKFH